ncbi:MAG TPA: hypothetical protein VGC06_29280 [Actinomycetes bacterium]
MTLESAFESLWQQAHELRDAVRAMQLTVVEDRPNDSDVVPVQSLGDAVGDLLGAVQEVLEATGDGLRAVVAGSGAGAARGALLRAQAAANDAARRLSSDVAERARLRDLEDLADSRGRAWRPWMAGVAEAVDRCGPPLWDVQCCLLTCWSDLTERLAEPPAAPSTTGIAV